jgi:hypothetical protein
LALLLNVVVSTTTPSMRLDQKNEELQLDNGSVRVEIINPNELVIGGCKITFPLPFALQDVVSESRALAIEIVNCDNSLIKVSSCLMVLVAMLI